MIDNGFQNLDQIQKQDGESLLLNSAYIVSLYFNQLFEENKIKDFWIAINLPKKAVLEDGKVLTFPGIILLHETKEEACKHTDFDDDDTKFIFNLKNCFFVEIDGKFYTQNFTGVSKA